MSGLNSLTLHRELHRHRLAYLALVLGLIGLTLLFLAVWPHRTSMRLVTLAMSIFYIGWGWLTHLKTSRLTRRVALEYLALGLFGGLLVWLVTL